MLITESSNCVVDCDTFFSVDQPHKLGEKVQCFGMMCDTSVPDGGGREGSETLGLCSELIWKIAGEDLMTLSHHKSLIFFYLLWFTQRLCNSSYYVLSVLDCEINNMPEILNMKILNVFRGVSN
jgi:hypothetical protein